MTALAPAAPAGVAPPSRRAALGAAVLVVLAWTVSTSPGAFDRPLTRASEARAWAVARTMVETGDVVVPRYQGEARLKKPPLQSWVQAAAMAVRGDTGLGVACFGSWLVGVLFAMGPWLLGRAVGRPEAGLLGSLLLCGSRAAGGWGASPEHDVPFAAWTGLAFVALARALGPSGRLRDAVAAGLACGAAVLTKGPFALAFVPGTALVLRWRATARGPLRGAAFWPALFLGATLPALAWLAAVAARHGSVGAVFSEMASQASGSEGAHTKPLPLALVYHLGALAKGCLPWSPIAAVAALHLLRIRRRFFSSAFAIDRGPSLRVPVVATLVTWGVLTATPAKQEHYVLPLLVPVALLAAHVVLRVVGASRVAARALPAALVAAGLGYLVSRWLPERPAGPGDVLLGSIVALGVALGSWRSPQRAAQVVVVMLGLAAGFDARRMHAAEDYRAAAGASPLGSRGDVRLVGFARGSGEAFDTLVAWLPGRYERVRSADALRAALARPGPSAVLVRVSDLGDLGALAGRLVRRGTLAPERPGSDRDRVAWFEPAP